jgi:hypothetical protein
MAKKLRPLEPRNLALAADLELEGAWRVEYFDSDGAGYIGIFVGQSAEVRARDYYDAIERGALDTRIADAQVVTAKKVISYPQKRSSFQSASRNASRRWCDCPPEYGPPTTIYSRFVRWARRGIWENLFRELARNGRSTDTQMIDSTHVKAYRSAAGLPSGISTALRADKDTHACRLCAIC